MREFVKVAHQIADPDSVPVGLGGVGGTDALLGRAELDLALLALVLLQAVDSLKN